MVFSLILVFACIVLTAAGQILVKKGMNEIGAITSVQQMLDLGLILRVFTNVFVISGILCFGLMLILWLFALSALDISSTYPLTSIVYIITAFAALIFLKEDISLIKWVGMFLIVGGCILLSSR
ncbi:MAG: EamA family transporter [Dehalococcoidia bacterium]|nr:EamA family transporter [Dehalococcoidia bacterium]MDD5493725.1 EamA family transporter [Dehalococcoidia bacterium]